jgi:thiol-disulfide isomerase/thioredoxin
LPDGWLGAGYSLLEEAVKAFLSRLLDRLLWIAAIAIVIIALWPKDSGPMVGARGAPFSAPLVGTGETFEYSGKSERPLLIEAFASWCGACRRSSPLLESVGEAAREGKLDVIAISVDDEAQAALSAKRQWPITLPVAHDRDGSFQRAYDVRVLPTFILLNRDGSVAHVAAGPPGASDLRRWLNPDN